MSGTGGISHKPMQHENKDVMKKLTLKRKDKIRAKLAKLADHPRKLRKAKKAYRKKFGLTRHQINAIQAWIKLSKRRQKKAVPAHLPVRK